jgi:hypothetical protein
MPILERQALLAVMSEAWPPALPPELLATGRYRSF